MLTDVTTSVTPPGYDPFEFGPVEFLDLEGDGDPDFVLVSTGEIFRNDGAGVFAATPSNTWLPPPQVATTRGMRAFDADGDGDVDIFVFQRNRQNMLFLNDGTGVFTDVTTTHLPVANDATFDVDVADVDADGDLDVFVSNSFADEQLLLNDGSGVLSVDPTPLPSILTSGYLVGFGDVDADGDPDLLLQGGSLFLPGETLWINDGSGQFVDETALRVPVEGSLASNAAFVDVDGDGDLDMLSGTVRLNDGTGVFGAGVQELQRATAAGDIDLDGDIDLLDGVEVLVGDGTGGSFETRRRGIWLQDEWSLRFEDVAGDMLSDIVIDSRGAILRDLRLRQEGIRTADLDGDGAMDLLHVEDCALTVYTGNGTGVFVGMAPIAIPCGTVTDRRVAIGDVDGDSDLDLVVGAQSCFFFDTQTQLLLNDGSAQFVNATVASMPVDVDVTTGGVELGDIDGDGDLDLVLAIGRPLEGSCSTNQPDRIYINDGSGVFVDESAARFSASFFERTGFARLGDVDEDGDLDLVTGTTDFQATRDRLYLNDGAGFFTHVPAGWLVPEVDFVDLVDLDGDGHLDVVGRSGVALGDGAGGFTPAGLAAPLLPDLADVQAAVGDWDGDGDVDVAQFFRDAPFFPRPRVFAGLLQHLEVLDFVRTGRSHRVRISARSADTGIATAVPLLSFTSVALDSPFGALGVDPATLVVLPAVAMPNGLGSTEFSLTVPADLALVDLRLYYQALVFDAATFEPRLTNLWLDQIIGG